MARPTTLRPALIAAALAVAWGAAALVLAQQPGPRTPQRQDDTGGAEVRGAGEAHETALGSAGATEYPLVTPALQGYGAVAPLTTAAEPLRAGARVLFDVAAKAGDAQVVPALEDVAELINLHALAPGPAGPADLRIAVVLHGPATTAALRDASFSEHTSEPANPNLPLVRLLRARGVEVFVCGQSVARYHFAMDEVAPEVQVAASAMSIVINRQMAGWAHLPYRGLFPYTDMPR